MIGLTKLVNALAATLSGVPELVQILAPVDPVVAYIDLNPTANSVDKAIYQMQPGQVLVVYRGTDLTEGEMSKWSHAMDICIRSLPSASDLDLIDAIMAGVPNPGDGMVWRNCPILDGLLPTKVERISRNTDTEGVDYMLIETTTLETGDWPNP
jgi:hypothetical protein